MRILIISPVFWPETFRVNDLALELVNRGHEVEVLAGMPNYPKGEFYDGYGQDGPFTESWQGITIHRFNHLLRGNGRAKALILHYLSWVKGSVFKAWSLRSSHWDRIFVFQTTPVTAAIPAIALRISGGTPTIIWVQDLWPEIVKASGLLVNPFLLKIIGFFSNRIYKSFDRIITQSDAFLDSLLQRDVPKQKLVRIYNWAEDIYRDANGTGRPPLEHQWKRDFVLMFTGNLGRMQSVPCLMEAAKILAGNKAISWVFIGDGAMRGWMEEFAISNHLLGQTVFFLGQQPLEEMPNYYALADAMLLGLGRSEALTMTIPGKLQGYLAAGKPVVASADGEAALIINRSSAGFASPAEDPQALADSVLRMYQLTTEARVRLGQNGRRFYELNFSREYCLGQLELQLINPFPNINCD